MRTLLVALFVAMFLCVYGCSQQERTVPTKDQQAGGCTGGVCPVPRRDAFDTPWKGPIPDVLRAPETRPEPECDSPDCPVHGKKKEKAIRVRLPAWSTRCDPLMGHYLWPQ